MRPDACALIGIVPRFLPVRDIMERPPSVTMPDKPLSHGSGSGKNANLVVTAVGPHAARWSATAMPNIAPSTTLACRIVFADRPSSPSAVM